MISKTELEAILFLLDDTDEEVVRTAEDRLFAEGADLIPLLEEFWIGQEDPWIHEKLESLIQTIQHQNLQQDFIIWNETGGIDLMEACLLVDRIQYPGLDGIAVKQFIEKTRLDAWMALYGAHSPLEKVQLLNHILFDRHGINGNVEQYHAIDNSMMHRLVETHAANPITICNLYSVIAQRLGLPVFGVNLPQHFVLAWCEELDTEIEIPFQSHAILERENFGKVLFYINPFSKGQVFLKKNVDEFLTAIKVNPRPEFYEPCSNLEILRRMLRNLHFSYSEAGNLAKVEEVNVYMNILGMTEDKED